MDFQDVRTVDAEVEVGDMRFDLSGQVVLSCEDSTAEVEIDDRARKVRLTITEEDWKRLDVAVRGVFATLKRGHDA